jgi:fructokinase
MGSRKSSGPSSTGAFRPGLRYPPCMRIGIDLGGTKIEGIVLDARGEVRARLRVPTPRNDYAATLNRILEVVEELEAPAGPGATIGIGTPGAVSPATGLIKNANSTWLNGRPLKDDLERRLGRTIRVANDANCFALSEATDGAAAGAAIVFGVIVGTGTGGGVVVDGRVLTGIDAVAGEWGHNPLPWPREDEHPGPMCWCGRRGCLETFLSGPGMVRDHRERTGETLEPAAIAARAAAGDEAARVTVDQYVDRMARGLATVVNLLDPDVVVLGGGMSNLEVLYDRVPESWGHYVFSDRVDTVLRPPAHGDSSGVRGAAWLWPAR